jgi:hypothetical protein
MTDKTIRNIRIVGGDHFTLEYNRKSKYKLNYFLTQFNFSDYWCFKSTRHQRLITEYSDLLNFDYSAYVFFRKELYNIDYILFWIKYMKEIGGIQFFDKHFPPFDPYKKINIIK